MSTPRYQELSGEALPTARTADGLAEVRVIAGEALGATARISTHTPIVYQDWTLQPGASLDLALPGELRVLAYVFEGNIRLGAQGATVEDGQLAVLGDGATVRLQGGTRPGRFLLLGGVPLREPVARYGPFVMNSRAEIVQAMEDFQSGRMGEITRTAEVTSRT